MVLNFKNSAILLSLILTIYLMRQAELSPGGFLKHQVTRITQQQKVSDMFCNNVEDETFTEAEKDGGNDYRSGIKNIRNDDTLTSYINRGEPKDTFARNYAKSMIPFLVPWAVFFVIGLVGCIFYVTNWCCMNCYLCKNCCRRACGRPKTNRFANGYATFSFVLMVLTIGAGIAGLVFSGRIPKYANATICSTVRFVETIQDGSEDGTWVGIRPGVSKVNKLVTDVKAAGTDLGDFNTIFDNINTNLDSVSRRLGELYDTYKDSTIQRADPAGGAPYTPVYVKNLGPLTNPDTITGMLNLKLIEQKVVIGTTAAGITPVTDELNGDIKSIANDVEGEIPTFVQVSDDIDSGLNEVAEHESTIHTIINVVKGVLLGVFIANTAVAALALLSIILVCFGVRFFNKTIHLSWCAMGLLMLAGWVISIGLFGGSIFLFETCDVGDGVLKDPVFFNKTFDTLNYVFELDNEDYTNTRNILYRCVHGDGDISEEFNLRNNLVMFDGIFNNIDKYSGIAQTIVAQIAESPYIPLQQVTLEELRIGYLPDSRETINDLATLNSLTNSNANTCTQVTDTWVLNSANCSETAGTAFKTDDPAGFNLPNPTCIGYDAWMARTRGISNRYGTSQFPQSDCGLQNNQFEYLYLQNFVNRFVTNRRENDRLLTNLKNGLNSINDVNVQLSANIQQFPTQINNINQTVGGIYDSLTNEQNGLIATSNCRFVVESFTEILDIGCTGLGSNVFRTALIFLIMSFVTFFGTLMLFCLAKRFISPNEDEKVNMKSPRNKKDRVKQYENTNSAQREPEDAFSKQGLM